jgi:hypothetical protein
MMHAGQTVRLSRDGLERLRDGYLRAGTNIQKYFRCKAKNLVRIMDPLFEVSGAPLDQTLPVTINSDLLAELRVLADDLNVPHETIGELVATHISRDAGGRI